MEKRGGLAAIFAEAFAEDGLESLNTTFSIKMVRVGGGVCSRSPGSTEGETCKAGPLASADSSLAIIECKVGEDSAG
jgi:hypothetical protein